jgi:hypothetical protein
MASGTGSVEASGVESTGFSFDVGGVEEQRLLLQYPAEQSLSLTHSTHSCDGAQSQLLGQSMLFSQLIGVESVGSGAQKPL